MTRFPLASHRSRALTGLALLSLVAPVVPVSEPSSIPAGAVDQPGGSAAYLVHAAPPAADTGMASVAFASHVSNRSGVSSPPTFAVARPQSALHLAHDGARLTLSRNTVTSPLEIEASSLFTGDVPPLDQGMTNVTRGPVSGYRFLPHMHFKRPIRLEIPYDKSLIPPGLSAADVHSFYFDERSRSWRPLARVGVDRHARVVTSVTPHFTDVINATITIPDHPETLSYTPTSISDLKAADPGAGIDLIEPPQASYDGDARLTYPIDLPPGRAGMEPQLALTYDSGAGDGWLGVGWDLPTPAVTIDTRWGVPRYSALRETETYSLNGMELTPVAHRGPLAVRTSERVFHTRVEGAFQRIIRHGVDPSDYWWEITDKAGTRSFYGGGPGISSPTPDATLGDAKGNIFEWALRETRDLHGNAVRYGYDTVTDPGVVGGVPGAQLYLSSINYTRDGTQPGAYTVRFVRDTDVPGYTRRPDVAINARGGFKMVTAALLQRIAVSFDDQLVRRYELDYEEGAFRKMRLKSITEVGANGSALRPHVFSYYELARDDGGYQGFGAASQWHTTPHGGGDFRSDLLNREPSALSGSSTTTGGGHVYAGFNAVIAMKQLSVGGKVGFSRSSTRGVLAMVDLNGDNLPDKVFDRHGTVFVRFNQSRAGAANFSDPPTKIATLPAISEETSNMFSYGAEAYLIANVFANQSETFTTNSTYFSDVNGDGLTDLVKDGAVLFNHLNSRRVPTFTPNSADTPVPIGGGTLDTHGIVENFGTIRQAQIDNNPLADTVRIWTAPFAGRVRVTGSVRLIADTSGDRSHYATADGVRVAIQHNGTELWADVITADDYAAKTPRGIGSISINKGDRLYFRVQSRFDGAYDQVAWNPAISYLDVPAMTDVNNLDVYRYHASQDFVLAGRRGARVQVPFNGTVHLSGALHKGAITSDDITLVVLKNDVPIFHDTLAWNKTGDIETDFDIVVAKEDTIELHVKVDSPIDVSQLRWTPQLFYTATSDVSPIADANGNPLIQLHPPYDVDMYPEDNLLAPQQPWTVPADGPVSVSPQLSVAPDADGIVTFTVKRRGALVAKRTIAVNHGSVADVTFFLGVRRLDQLFFDFSVRDPELAKKIAGASVRVLRIPTLPITVPSAVHAAQFPGFQGQPYRGWSYAGYNGNEGRASQPIVEADLREKFDEDSSYDPRTAHAYLFAPFPEDKSWRGPDDLGWVRSGSMSSSRMGLDTIDVPRPAEFAGGRAVSRFSHTSQTATGAGLILVGGSNSDGTATGEVDYIDLNGDGFPDIVGDGGVQYTTMTGGLEPNSHDVTGLGPPRDTHATSWNVGVGGSPASFSGSGRGEIDTSGKAPPASNRTGSQMTRLGLFVSAGLGGGHSTPNRDLVDVNGDGLPDRVLQAGDQLLVRLNLGYSFEQKPEIWGTAAINDGASENGTIGASLGFNSGDYGFAGGAALTKNKSETSATLLDLNGDGLLDRVLPTGDEVRVGFNTGNGFASPVMWRGGLDGVCRDDTSIGQAGIDWAKTRVCTGNISMGGGGYFTIGIGPICYFACYVIINPGGDGDDAMSRDEAGFRDVDGDGYLDHVASTDDSSMVVARNLTGRTNLLKSIQRPLGATIDLEYARDGNTYEQPNSRWVLSKVSVSDGHPGDGADRQVTTYRYEDGFYSRLEREFFGYGKVIEQQLDAANANAAYRTTVREFLNDSYYTRGLVSSVRVLDGAGRPFTETENTYRLRDIDTGVAAANPQSQTATIFPKLTRTDRRFYEGHANPGKSTFATQRYDALGNIVHFMDAGDPGARDDRVATIKYSSCAGTHVVAEPVSIVITGGDGTELRRREASVDCPTGDLMQVRQFLAGGTAAVTALRYTADGNLRQVTGPPNTKGERYQLNYEYDPVVRTHITGTSDSFGYSSTATHDYRFGTVATTTDVNGNRTSYAYDEFGRLASVTGPYEQGTGTPTIRFEYHPNASVPWALTQHLDKFRNRTDPIDTVLFIDGLKRVIQTKKDATVHTDQSHAPADVMTVSGRITFDFLGRTTETYYPITEPLGTPGVFNAAYDSVQPTRTTYDVLDRSTSVTLPDYTVTTMAYGFGKDREGATQFRTAMTDANGIEKRTYRNVRDLITSRQEFHSRPDGTVQEIWTSYSYDPLDQLVEVKDDQGNVSRMTYDNLGRRTVVDNPDSGTTRTVYDLASNPIAKITANLRAEGTQITYDYDFTRLRKIVYPDFHENDVTYTYGAPAAAFNRAGRIARVIDESGLENRFYGQLGEVVKEIKTVASDTQGNGPNSPEVYATGYTYDTFGRLQQLVYPDGEVLTYKYDAGGMARQATGQKGSHAYRYVERLEYDKFGQRAFMESGNGVQTVYSYDPLSRRLSNLKAGKNGTNPFQDINYVYDDVGNVLRLSNNVAVPHASQSGGPTSQTYHYDDLYRLTGATGTYAFAPNKSDRYSLDMTYDSVNNIMSKDQDHEVVEPSGVPIVQHATTYDWAYRYGGVHPHAPTHIGPRTFRYDANGNQVAWTHDANGTRRAIVWDEENRVQSVIDNGHRMTYKYNDAGERVIKRGPQGETVYVNPYFEIRNREIGTKNVFVGSTRVVSKLVKQNKPQGNPNGNQPLEKNQYFFHPDNLGSTNYVTDANGTIYQHLEYFPFGESWVNESSNIQRTPYLFTGKELDEETGLYYFGARYYDPRTQIWASPDPALGSVLTSHRQELLNVYAYSLQNPLVYTDPNGLESQRVSILTTAYWKHVYEGYRYYADVYLPEEQHDYDVVHDVLYEEIDRATPLIVKMFPMGATDDPVEDQVQELIGSRPHHFGEDLTAAIASFLLAKAGTPRAAGPASAEIGNERLVIGKMADLERTGAIAEGETTLPDRMQDMGSPQLNWQQNAGMLRQEMSRGLPIRDVSVDPMTGELTSNTGFLRAERALLEGRGWRYNPQLTQWQPPPTGQ
jgi:RHS repeat-associated protein